MPGSIPAGRSRRGKGNALRGKCSVKQAKSAMLRYVARMLRHFSCILLFREQNETKTESRQLPAKIITRKFEIGKFRFVNCGPLK